MGSQFQKPLIGTQINWGHPLSKGLVGCWLMNEGAGDRIYDLSLNGNDGEIGVQFPKWISGLTGSALDFDGVSDSISLPSSNVVFPDNNNWTTDVWFNIQSNTGNGRIFAAHYSAVAGSAIGHLSGNDDYRFYFRDGDNNVTISVIKTGLGLNTWNFGVATYNGSVLKVYVNGALEFIKTDDFKGYGSFPAEFGAFDGDQFEFPGLIDSSRIWNRALSPQEVSELYLNPYGMFEHLPIWMFPTIVPTVAAGFEYQTKQNAYNFLTKDNQYIFDTKAQDYNFDTLNK